MISLLTPRIAPYIAGAAIVALLVGGWRYTVHQAYQRGYSDAEAAQAVVNADTFRNIIEEYTDATGNPIDGAVADCVLRSIATGGIGEECGDLHGNAE